MTEERNQATIYETAIGMLPGVGIAMTRVLVSYCGSAEQVFKASKTKLKAIPNIGETIANHIITHADEALNKARQIVAKADAMGASILFYTHPEYPAVLKNYDDSPTLLYYKGTEPLNHPRAIALVGTRQATEYGKACTEAIIKAIAPYNPLIISGLAYGIDIMAHKTALKYGLKTIAVMGTGLDLIYPASHKQVALEIRENGGLLTENTFGVKPDAPRFPERNRIIAGLADATLVIEASEKGGALITAEIANSYHKEVFAVPGRLNETYSSGCNKLIRLNKARILDDPEQLAFELQWTDAQQHVQKPKHPKAIDLSRFDAETRTVVEALIPTMELEIDELAWKTGYNVNKLSSILLHMEFDGVVKPMPGKKFKLMA